MADRAHYFILLHQRAISKLIEMTADAGFVTGKFQFCRFAFAPVAGGTFKLFMLGDFVRECLKFFCRNAFGERLRRFRRG